jgi:ADP-heptose:LPS heptosyltransferase
MAGARPGTCMASLVIRPEKIGDLVVATPVFRALKASFPDEPVHLLTDEINAPLVRQDPHLDRILTIPWRSRYRGHRPSLPALHSLIAKNGPYRRAAVLFYDYNPWNWLAGLNGIRHVAQIGGTLSAILWHHRMVLRRNHVGGEPMFELYLKVAEKIGAHLPPDPALRKPRLYVSDAERAAILERFPALAAPDRILIHPFSVSAGANIHPPDYFKLARHLVETTPFRVYFLGTAAEGRSASFPAHPRISSELVGQLDLRELMAACSHADLVIGGSSGTVHVSAAIGTPTLGLYCPAYRHDLVWGPQGPWTKVLVAPADCCKRIAPAQSGCAWPGFCNLAFAFTPELIRREAGDLIRRARESGAV